MHVATVFRNAAMASSQVLLSGGMLFALYYFLLRQIGPSQLGIWSIVLATSSAVRLSELGLSGGVVRFVAKYVARQDEISASNVIQTAVLSIATLLALILVLFFPIIGSLLRYFIPPEGYLQGMNLLPFAFISLWLGTIGGIFTSGLDGVLRTDVRSYIMIGGTAIHLALVFVLVPTYGLLGLGYSQVIQSTFILVLSWCMLRRELSSLPLFPYRWDRRLFSEMFKYGLNIQVGSVAQMLFDPATKMLLSKFGGLDSVAFFEMADRMVKQVRSLVVSANQVMIPVFSKMQEEAPEQISSVYQKSYGLLLFVALPIFSGIVAMTPIISQLWIGMYQPLFVSFSLILAVGWFLSTLITPAYISNMGTGHLGWNTMAHLVVGVLNIIFGAVFGYMFGGKGVVAGFVVALVLGSVLVIVNYHRKHKISFSVLIPKKHVLFFLASIFVPICSWNLYEIAEKRFGLAITSVVVSSLVAGTFCSLAWFHPLRKKILARMVV